MVVDLPWCAEMFVGCFVVVIVRMEFFVFRRVV